MPRKDHLETPPFLSQTPPLRLVSFQESEYALRKKGDLTQSGLGEELKPFDAVLMSPLLNWV